MAASYPTAVKVFTTKADGVDYPQAAHVNDLQDEVNAIEQDILTNGLTLTSGKIKFPATQVPSAGANDLDDYEEGTFTPGLASTGGGAIAAPTTAAGFYTKVGRKVDFSLRLTLNGLGTLAAGDVSITGLPFAANNTTGYFGGATVHISSLTTAIVSANALVFTGASAISLFIRAAAAVNPTALAMSDLGGGTDFILTGSYFV